MLTSLDKCTGCGACAAVCPNNCIKMVPDREGFRQPEIDADKCVHCRLCERICPVLQKPATHKPPVAFAAKHQNADIRTASSSGGVFTALAEAVLQKGGIVCAAKYDEDFSVIHDFAQSTDDLAQFRGAKYTQSKAEHCFAAIKQMLLAGKTVLFVGTPCQVAGLSSYIGKPDPNLILVDMICHGVPSPTVWKRYLQERQQIDSRSKVQSINLRCKRSGWSRYRYSVQLHYADGNSYLVPQGQDWFMQGFVENLYLRRSCETCGFKGIQRCSDLTLGDFWGIWDLSPEFDDDCGVSLLWVHSNIGNTLWQEVSPQFDLLPLPVEASVRSNPSALTGSKPHKNRDIFFMQLNNTKVIPLIQKMLTTPEQKPSLIKRILNRFKK